ncbi:MULTISPECIES: hypothetical protein [Xanthomonas]|uniref:hypothetical protein n=1 Tax=Xanthomonas TaxID=338 RepID=UPI0012FE9B15|nr:MULTISPECIES: hypothetical protein [Xanthomonas]
MRIAVGRASVFCLRRRIQARMLFSAPATLRQARQSQQIPRSIRSIAMKRLFDSLSRWVQSLGGRKLGYIYTY